MQSFRPMALKILKVSIKCCWNGWDKNLTFLAIVLENKDARAIWMYRTTLCHFPLWFCSTNGSLWDYRPCETFINLCKTNRLSLLMSWTTELEIHAKPLHSILCRSHDGILSQCWLKVYSCVIPDLGLLPCYADDIDGRSMYYDQRRVYSRVHGVNLGEIQWG